MTSGVGPFLATLIVPPAPTCSRARNPITEGSPLLRSRRWPPRYRWDQPHISASTRLISVSWHWRCGPSISLRVLSFSSRPKIAVVTSIVALRPFAEAVSLGSRARDVARGSAPACELRAADVPRPVAFLSKSSPISVAVLSRLAKVPGEKDRSSTTSALFNQRRRH